MLPNAVIQPFHCKKLINIQNLCHGTRGVVSLLIFIACISEIRNLLLFFQGTFYFSNVCFTSLTYILTKCIVAQNWEIMRCPPLNGCMINCLSSTKLMVANFRLEKLFVFHGLKMQKIPNYDCCYYSHCFAIVLERSQVCRKSHRESPFYFRTISYNLVQ